MANTEQQIEESLKAICNDICYVEGIWKKNELDSNNQQDIGTENRIDQIETTKKSNKDFTKYCEETLGTCKELVNNFYDVDEKNVPDSVENSKQHQQYQSLINPKGIIPVSTFGNTTFSSPNMSFKSEDKDYTSVYLYVRDLVLNNMLSTISVKNGTPPSKPPLYFRHSYSSSIDYRRNINVKEVDLNESIDELKQMLDTNESNLHDLIYKHGKSCVQNGVFVQSVLENDMLKSIDESDACFVNHTILSSQQRSLLFEKDLGIHPLFYIQSEKSVSSKADDFIKVLSAEFLRKGITQGDKLKGTDGKGGGFNITESYVEYQENNTIVSLKTLFPLSPTSTEEEPYNNIYTKTNAIHTNCRIWPTFVLPSFDPLYAIKTNAKIKNGPFAHLQHFIAFNIDKIFAVLKVSNGDKKKSTEIGTPDNNTINNSFSIIFDSKIHNVALLDTLVSRYFLFHFDLKTKGLIEFDEITFFFCFKPHAIMSQRLYDTIFRKHKFESNLVKRILYKNKYSTIVRSADNIKGYSVLLPNNLKVDRARLDHLPVPLLNYVYSDLIESVASDDYRWNDVITTYLLQSMVYSIDIIRENVESVLGSLNIDNIVNVNSTIVFLYPEYHILTTPLDNKIFKNIAAGNYNIECGRIALESYKIGFQQKFNIYSSKSTFTFGYNCIDQNVMQSIEYLKGRHTPIKMLHYTFNDYFYVKYTNIKDFDTKIKSLPPDSMPVINKIMLPIKSSDDSTYLFFGIHLNNNFLPKIFMDIVSPIIDEYEFRTYQELVSTIKEMNFSEISLDFISSDKEQLHLLDNILKIKSLNENEISLLATLANILSDDNLDVNLQLKSDNEEVDEIHAQTKEHVLLSFSIVKIYLIYVVGKFINIWEKDYSFLTTETKKDVNSSVTGGLTFPQLNENTKFTLNGVFSGKWRVSENEYLKEELETVNSYGISDGIMPVFSYSVSEDISEKSREELELLNKGYEKLEKEALSYLVNSYTHHIGSLISRSIKYVIGGSSKTRVHITKENYGILREHFSGAQKSKRIATKKSFKNTQKTVNPRTNRNISADAYYGQSYTIELDLIDCYIETLSLSGYLKNYILLNHGYLRDVHSSSQKAICSTVSCTSDFIITTISEMYSGVNANHIISPYKGTIEKYYREYRDPRNLTENPLFNIENTIRNWKNSAYNLSKLDLHKTYPNSFMTKLHQPDSDNTPERKQQVLYINPSDVTKTFSQLNNYIGNLEWRKTIYSTSQNVKIGTHFGKKISYLDVPTYYIDPYAAPLNRFHGNGLKKILIRKNKNGDPEIIRSEEEYKRTFESCYMNMNDGLLPSLCYSPSVSFFTSENNSNIIDYNVYLFDGSIQDLVYTLKEEQGHKSLKSKTYDGNNDSHFKVSSYTQHTNFYLNTPGGSRDENKLLKFVKKELEKPTGYQTYLCHVLMSKTTPFGNLLLLPSSSVKQTKTQKRSNINNDVRGTMSDDNISKIAKDFGLRQSFVSHGYMWIPSIHRQFDDITPSGILNSIYLNKIHTLNIATGAPREETKKKPSLPKVEKKTYVVLKDTLDFLTCGTQFNIVPLSDVSEKKMSLENRLFLQNGQRNTYFDIACATIPTLIKNGTLKSDMLNRDYWKYAKNKISNPFVKDTNSNIVQFVSDYISKYHKSTVSPCVFLMHHKSVTSDLFEKSKSSNRSDILNSFTLSIKRNALSTTNESGLFPSILYLDFIETMYQSSITSIYTQDNQDITQLFHKTNKNTEINNEFDQNNIAESVKPENYNVNTYINASLYRHITRLQEDIKTEKPKAKSNVTQSFLSETENMLKCGFPLFTRKKDHHKARRNEISRNIPAFIGSVDAIAPYQICKLPDYHSNNFYDNVNHIKLMLDSDRFNFDSSYSIIPIYSLDRNDNCNYITYPIIDIDKNKSVDVYRMKDILLKEYLEGQVILAIMSLISCLWLICKTAKIEALEIYKPIDILKLICGSWLSKDNINSNTKKSSTKNNDSSKNGDVDHYTAFINKNCYDLFEKEFTGVADVVLMNYNTIDGKGKDTLTLKTTSVRGNENDMIDLKYAFEYIYDLPKMYRQHVGHTFTKYEKNLVYVPRTISTVTEEKLKKYDVLGTGGEESLMNTYNKYITYARSLLKNSDTENLQKNKDILKNIRKELEQNIIKRRSQSSANLMEYQQNLKDDKSNENVVTKAQEYEYIQKMKIHNEKQLEAMLENLKYVDELTETNALNIQSESTLMDNQLLPETASIKSSIEKFNYTKGSLDELNNVVDSETATSSISVATILHTTLNKSIDVSFFSAISPIQRDSFNICYTLLKILDSGGTSMAKSLDIGSGFTSNMLLNEQKGIIKEILDSSISTPSFSLWKAFPSSAFETSHINSLISDQ